MLYKFLGDNSENDRDFETLKREEFFASTYASLNDPRDAPRHCIDRNSIKKLPNPKSKKIASETLAEIDNFGVYCLSTENTSPAMWAFYANGWQGLCIEYAYSTGDFFHELRKIYTKEVFIAALRMNYSEKIKKLDAIDLVKLNPLVSARHLFGQKTIHWEHEKEFRLIFNKSGLFHVPSSMISKVYLGHKMKPEQKNKYFELFSKKGIPIFEASSNTTDVDLNLKPLDSMIS